MSDEKTEVVEESQQQQDEAGYKGPVLKRPWVL